MSLSVGAIAGLAALSGGIQGGNSLGTSWFNSVLSDKNNKDSQSRSETYSTQNLINEYLLGRQAVKEDAETNYDWSLAYARQRDDDQYSLARKYAENSASWEKQGMVNAGVNPILAYGSLGNGIQYSASNQGLSSASGGSPSADTPSSASPSASGGHGIDLAEIARDVKSLDNMDAQVANVKANTDTINALRDTQVSSAKADVQSKSSQANVNDAQAAKIEAEAEQVKANTALSLVRAQNELENGGMKGTFGAILSRVLPKTSHDDRNSKAIQLMQRSVGKPYVDAHRGARNIPSSARSNNAEGENAQYNNSSRKSSMILLR